MTVRRLGIVTPTLNTDTDLVTVTDNYLVSVIATNTNSSAPADVRIWVEPSGAATADEYSYIAYDIEINVGNALETHRFAVNSGDTVRVRATTSDVSFTASGIPQTTIIGYGTEPLDYLDFNTSSTATLVEGRVIWDDGEGSPTIGLKGGEVQLNLGQENVALCYNGTGSQLTSGQVVYISGAQGQKPSISLAAATSESTSSKTFGMVTETIENGSEGFVTTFGIVNNVNTLGFTEGSALWLSTTAGQYTQSPPTSPNHLVFVGYCLKANETAGRIFINPQNGYELEELHDILISSLQDGQALVYESASGLWKNASIDAFPDQTSHAGEFLTTDGTSVSWAIVDALPSQTGNSGKYLTTDGTDASWADLDLIPDQTGNSGKFLTTDGSLLSWDSIDSVPMQIGTSFPLTAVDGDTFFNYSNGIMYIYVFGAWMHLVSMPPIDGGSSSTATFDGVIDGGTASSTFEMSLNGGNS